MNVSAEKCRYDDRKCSRKMTMMTYKKVKMLKRLYAIGVCVCARVRGYTCYLQQRQRVLSGVSVVGGGSAQQSSVGDCQVQIIGVSVRVLSRAWLRDRGERWDDEWLRDGGG